VNGPGPRERERERERELRADRSHSPNLQPQHVYLPVTQPITHSLRVTLARPSSTSTPWAGITQPGQDKGRQDGWTARVRCDAPPSLAPPSTLPPRKKGFGRPKPVSSVLRGLDLAILLMGAIARIRRRDPGQRAHVACGPSLPLVWPPRALVGDQ
jgi:hypothetical protein